MPRGRGSRPALHAFRGRRFLHLRLTFSAMLKVGAQVWVELHRRGSLNAKLALKTHPHTHKARQRQHNGPWTCGPPTRPPTHPPTRPPTHPPTHSVSSFDSLSAHTDFTFLTKSLHMSECLDSEKHILVLGEENNWLCHCQLFRLFLYRSVLPGLWDQGR